MLVVLVIQQVMSMHHIILSSVASPAVPYVFIFFKNGTIFGKKKLLNATCVFRFSLQCACKLYVVRTVHFGMKLYNDQRNAQAFNLFIYLLLPYMFQALF
jgi:hypothetical protein